MTSPQNLKDSRLANKVTLVPLHGSKPSRANWPNRAKSSGEPAVVWQLILTVLCQRQTRLAHHLLPGIAAGWTS